MNDDLDKLCCAAIDRAFQDEVARAFAVLVENLIPASHPEGDPVSMFFTAVAIAKRAYAGATGQR